MSMVASQIINLTIVYSTVYSLFGRRSKKTSKLRVTGLCEVTGEFLAQRANNAENVSIWWRHHDNLVTDTHRYIHMHINGLSQH